MAEENPQPAVAAGEAAVETKDRGMFERFLGKDEKEKHQEEAIASDLEKVHVSEPDKPTEKEEEKHSSEICFLDGVGAPAMEGDGGGGAPSFSEYSLSDLKAATDNFSSDFIVSEGGEKAPNVVYKGRLQNNRWIAVKKFTKLAWPDPKQFAVLYSTLPPKPELSVFAPPAATACNSPQYHCHIPLRELSPGATPPTAARAPP